MRTEGAGKGDALRQGVDWKRFSANYDAIFRKRKRKFFVERAEHLPTERKVSGRMLVTVEP